MRHYSFKTLTFAACLLCSMSAVAAEAYACYTPSNTTLTFYCDNQRDSRESITYDLNSDTDAPEWYDDGTFASVTRVVFDTTFADERPTSTFAWFGEMSGLQTIIGLEDNLKTDNVIEMGNMFLGCLSLTSLDLSNFNTVNVKDMSNMFFGCAYLSSLDLSSFNTVNVTSMHDMFYSCASLTRLDLSNFNTRNVKNMRRMFDGCSHLTKLDLGGFITDQVEDMHDMFNKCINLTRLDLSSFNTANVTNMSNMFKNCKRLTTIYAGSGWSTEAVVASSDMFSACSNLVGGMGTTFDTNHVDYAYAHIDGGPSNLGYFALRGDVNGDGQLSINDVTMLIDQLLGDGDFSAYADVNGDGVVTIKDVTDLIDILLSGY